MHYEAIQGRHERDPTLEEAFGLLDYLYYLKNDEYKLGYDFEKTWIGSNKSPLSISEARRLFLKSIEKMFGYKLAGKRYHNREIYKTFFQTLFEKHEIAIITTMI